MWTLGVEVNTPAFRQHSVRTGSRIANAEADLRFAVRSLNKDRKFTLLAVLALSLGIGSVTVIFSAIYGVVIDTFPYEHFNRMVSFSIDPIGQAAGSGREAMTIPEFLDYRQDNSVFLDMAGGTGIPGLHWTHDNQTTQWTDTDMNAGGYQFFGVKPSLRLPGSFTQMNRSACQVWIRISAPVRVSLILRSPPSASRDPG